MSFLIERIEEYTTLNRTDELNWKYSQGIQRLCLGLRTFGDLTTEWKTADVGRKLSIV